MGNPTATLYDNDSSRSKGKVVGNSPQILHCSTVLEVFNYIRRIRCPDSRYWRRCGGASRSLIAIYCGLV